MRPRRDRTGGGYVGIRIAPQHRSGTVLHAVYQTAEGDRYAITACGHRVRGKAPETTDWSVLAPDACTMCVGAAQPLVLLRRAGKPVIWSNGVERLLIDILCDADAGRRDPAGPTAQYRATVTVGLAET